MPTAYLSTLVASRDVLSPPASGIANPRLVAHLCRLGVACGRLPEAHGVSSLPHLRHARGLAALQRRYPAVRLRWLRGAAAFGHGDVDRLPHGQVGIVLQGRWRVELVGAGADVAPSVVLEPLEWIALPPGMRHRKTAAESDAEGASWRSPEWLVLDLAEPSARRPAAAEGASASVRGVP